MAQRIPTTTLILAITSGTLFMVFLVWAAAVLFLHPAPSKSFDPVSAHNAWKMEVADRVGSLTEHAQLHDIQSVKQDVLSLTVTADDRDADLALVLALSAFERGEQGSYAKLQTALAATQR